MNNYFLLLVGLCLAGTSFGQGATPQKAFIEHFTQASCGPCASQNPAMYATLDNFGASNYVKVTYQVSWPGVDPMNAAYPAGPNDRRNYYGVTGVPNATLNGGSPGGPNTIVSTATLNTAANQMTDIAITVNHVPTTGNNYDVYVKVENLGTAPTAAGLKLHTALTEKEVIYTSAPGSNGETEFFYVVRNMYDISTGNASTDGYTMPAIPAGDSIVYTTAVAAPNYIADVSQIGFAFWVQDDNSKDVLQAEYSVPFVPPTALDVSTSSANYGSPTNYCNNANWTPYFEVTNETANMVTSVEAQYTINGGAPQTTTLSNLSLTQGQSATVAFNAATLTGGANQIVYSIVSLNGGDPDYVGSNNSGLSGSVAVLTSSPTATTLSEDFTNAPLPNGTWQYSQYLPGAIFENPDGLAEGRFGVFGENSPNVDVSNCIRAAYGSGDWNNKSGSIVFDNINLANHNTFSFDYAHALTGATGDSELEILVSTDCGVTWTSLWQQQGAQLSTAAANSSGYFYPTGPADWMTASIPLTNYAGQNVAIKFAFAKGTSANNLYIDNIQTSFVSSVETINAVGNIAIMPNPVKHNMNVEITVKEAQDLQVAVVNALGQQVKTIANQNFVGSTNLTVNTSDLSNGVYFLNIMSEKGLQTKRFVVSK